MDSTISETLSHVSLLARHVGKYDLRGAALIALMELGAPTKCLGFELAVRAILMQHKDPTRALANDIYWEILRSCRLNTEDQVDQLIREMIKAAWKNGSKTAWNWYFSYDGEPPQRKPTNAEFISRIAYILELWCSCDKEDLR